MELLPNIYNEIRPWGSFERFTLNEMSSVKILRVSAGKRFSLQKHSKRNEYWKIIEGSGIVQVGDILREVVVGDAVEIPIGSLHRLTGGPEGIACLEICTGEFDEEDIVRTEDDFGRIPHEDHTA
jgi:mannose-6-phosphate isomerase-like protein (cupin superfamily)